MLTTNTIRFPGWAWLVGLLILTATLSSGAAPDAGFVLRDYLGHAWTNECVTFPLTPPQAAQLTNGAVLLGPDGQEVACQPLPGAAGADRICFQADLAPYGTAAYRLSTTRPASRATSDLQVTEDARTIQVVNSRIGIRIRKALTAEQGPIDAVRVGATFWSGGSTRAGGVALTAYTARVVTRGPVMVEVECRATFADQGYWTLRFRVERAEPVVLVDEQFDAPGGGMLQVALGGNGFQPTHLYHRDAAAERAGVLSEPIGNYYLEPWLHWNNGRHGRWFGLYTPTPAGGASSAMLVMGVIKPSLWVDPQWAGKAPQAGAGLNAAVRGGVMNVDMPVQGGRRVWLLGVLDTAASEQVLAAQDRRVAPPPQKLLIKHGDIPLELVKTYVLDWPGDDDNHPLLYVRKQDLPALKARLTSDPTERQRWVSQQPIDKYLLEGPIKEYCASGDAQLGIRMAQKAQEYLQTCTDWYLEENYLQGPGTAPHMQTLLVSTLNLIDPVLSTAAFTPEERKRVLAKLAFMGYVISSMDYWSPERGYSGFANMTSVVALYRAALGCMLPHHPQAKVWADQGLGQLQWQLKAWSDEDGGWLEAPHYAMVSFDHMLAGFTMAANAGYADYAFDPRMRKVAEWFGAISTPRDSRVGGFRHQPPIGNTYHGEPTGVYGQIAALWKDKDPQFASGMQWLFEQHGSFGGLGIGWNFPSMLGYRFLMSQNGVAAKPMELGSRWFRNTGVVLRNTMQPDRETYLHLIAGGNHDHYDLDSGSILVYGKGRILCDDWGYIGRHPDYWHSMLTSPDAWGGANMSVKTFATAPGLDYVRGQKGAWTREIAFAKDADPQGPTYFLLRDTHESDAAATWRLWLTGKAVTINDNGATLEGAEDVDMDILIYQAGTLKLATETASQNVSCSYRAGREQPGTITQIALTGTLAGRGAISAVLYPRLKTEPPPKVTWAEDGKIAQVDSAAGRDVLFVLPPEKKTVQRDGKSLIALRWEDLTHDLLRLGLTASATPNMEIQYRKVDPAAGAGKLPPDYLTVHPSEKRPVTVVWQSPITGTVSVDAWIADGDPAATGADAWRSDGVLYELRTGQQSLRKGAIANGGPEARFTAENITVTQGQLVRLVISPGPSEWWDTTQVDLTVRAANGQKWNLRESVLRGEKLGNQLSGSATAKAVWWVCDGDAETFDPRLIGNVLKPMTEVTATPQSLQCGIAEHNTPFLVMERGTADATTDVAKLPANFLQVHPGPLTPVAVVWRSPVTDTVSVEARVADGDAGTNEADGWRSDGVLYELRKGEDLLDHGAIANGGGEVKATAQQLAVKKGDLVRLLIYPGPCEWWDSTNVEMVVRDAAGKQWSLREALLRGEKLGNEVGADPAKAVWWACEGDAAQFDPSVLNPPPGATYTSPDGKVKLQGTIGSVQMRGAKVTLSLGARGIIRVGNKELAADSATSKTEAR